MWNLRWKMLEWCWRTAGVMYLTLSLTSQVKGTDPRTICVQDRIEGPGIRQTASLSEDMAYTYAREKNTVVFEIDVQRQKITKQTIQLAANLLTEGTATVLRDVSVTQSEYRVSKLMQGNVSLASVHPSPHFPFGTERGTTVIGYYATLDCSSARFLPGGILKQIVVSSRTRLERAAGGDMIGDPVLFIRGPSNLQALDREYFLGLGALGLLALLLLCAGWQGTGDEVVEAEHFGVFADKHDCYRMV
ncbi:uncharacterized protein LOC144926994 [Branchiostoma floridae x Branchiostoma belcheri]